MLLLTTSTQQLHFNAFIWPNGYHESAWRVVDDDVRNVLGLSYHTDIARTAERGLMDSVFLADNIVTTVTPLAAANFGAPTLADVDTDGVLAIIDARLSSRRT